MFAIVAFVCLIGQDPSECQRPTAQSVMKVGDASSEMECALSSQRLAAARANLLLGDGFYLKLACERRR